MRAIRAIHTSRVYDLPGIFLLDEKYLLGILFKRTNTSQVS